MKYLLFFTVIFLSFSVSAQKNQADYDDYLKVLEKCPERLKENQQSIIKEARYCRIDWNDEKEKYEPGILVLDSVLTYTDGKDELIVYEKRGSRNWEARILPLPSHGNRKKAGTSIDDTSQETEPEEKKYESSIDSILSTQYPLLLMDAVQDELISLFYRIDGQIYEVIYWTSYNCYDPMCGSKHGHVRMSFPMAYSPDFGILLEGMGRVIRLPDENIPTKLMQKVLKKYPPHEELLKVYEGLAK